MNKLDATGVRFFKQELIDETNRQLSLFEGSPPPEIASREFGRLRLYEDKTKIERHFFVCRTDIGAYESNHPQHGLIGPLEGSDGSSCLVWRELEGLRHSLRATVDTELKWENNSLPEARLTLKGEFKKKQTNETD